jgi:hypothetical protein
MGMDNFNSFCGKQPAKLPRAAPIKARPASQLDYLKPVSRKSLTQFADLIQAGNQEMVTVLKSADESVNQNLRAPNWQTVHNLTNRPCMGAAFIVARPREWIHVPLQARFRRR